MSRPLRIQIAGGVYHVTSRGNRRERIFVDDHDRRALLEILGRALLRCDAAALAYCLMNNHYHLVLQTRRANLSRLMRLVNGAYAQGFNQRHGLVGHLFQGRFHAVHVDRDAYLLEVCRYTDLNPVRAGLVDSADDWEWSSCRAHCGLVAAPRWLDTGSVAGYLLGADVRSAPERLRAAHIYASFVASAATPRLRDEALRQQIFLGDATFAAQAQSQTHADDARDGQLPQAHPRMPVSMYAELDVVELRRQAVHRAYVEEGRTMREIARAVGLSVSQVSRLVAHETRRVGELGHARRQRRGTDAIAADDGALDPLHSCKS